ncbi:MAG: fructosamine kinase family protein [Zymomonas mobilis subsp. pomaceae]|uniref:Aminoglycoside phosphotransferase n=1 Tax=Zymomonas mobilis subsp. pomaceae (strain ATCC 29192 / DSM 22645 / JCM 10191 / CCUG 17912 / NBRC 13757 / NCIMB 11200 / NRRL B-4491 / Barker I) TaxID=579138 RepID=F8ETD1_ZYMMT|nr:fructosamine kinase family protein [Zymomonas mobilis]AEI37956.1 aminoglycoside phosphotransferase [Zymomonas mobilis subsp. pomaceae ATCC 29192]MDX5949324.1 fructosamine kinase family protein [Zymomonas mobilis subsp. pomaceae]GEB89669.1 aminoglycoside phosphotransferase [Zymomonas mobilis subsp. pomaceae]
MSDRSSFSVSNDAARLIGQQLMREERLHGGDLSQVTQLWLEDGSHAVAKNSIFPDREAQMLEAIAKSGAPAPQVLAVDDKLLVMQWLRNRDVLHHAWSDLGKVLALLHTVHGPLYGWNHNYGLGNITILNGWMRNWPDFWGEYRLRPHLPHISPDLVDRLEELIEDLPQRLPMTPKPVLLHGDLWDGNILVDDGRIVGLIDPCCYYGDAEVDIAMINLFDRPSGSFYESYETYHPLMAGYEERLNIYKLWPALVHLRLFGDGYRPLVTQLLKSAGV